MLGGKGTSAADLAGELGRGPRQHQEFFWAYEEKMLERRWIADLRGGIQIAFAMKNGPVTRKMFTMGRKMLT